MLKAFGDRFNIILIICACPLSHFGPFLYRPPFADKQRLVMCPERPDFVLFLVFNVPYKSGAYLNISCFADRWSDRRVATARPFLLSSARNSQIESRKGVQLPLAIAAQQHVIYLVLITLFPPSRARSRWRFQAYDMRPRVELCG